MTLSIAFIGAGQMARHHASALGRLRQPSVVVGVHDRAPGRAEELAALAGCRPFPSWEALLQDTRPDIVHVCTPPATHFEAAAAALEGGAHVYVEKPFALNVADAQALLETAKARRRLVCAGHQILRDSAFLGFVAGVGALGTLVQVDSDFAFRPVGIPAAGAGASTLASLLVDVLPHPLYSLVSVLERFAPGERIDLAWARAEPADLQAVLVAGPVAGRLSVSLRARPVASSITATGTGGSLTCDLVRSTVVGAANPGTEPLEKALNPMIEGAHLLLGTGRGLLGRLRAGAGYPGLREMIEAFYEAVAAGGPSPVPPAHLLNVTHLFEQLVERIDRAVPRRGASSPRAGVREAPLVVVTGAGGFLGSAVSRALPRVRGMGRRAEPGDPRPGEWVAADLGDGLPPEALAGADVVVHAAAETSGGYAEQRRNTVLGTRHLLWAMQAAGVRRLVLISSLSVLRPPRTPWERQDERTPRPRDPQPFGPYTWGKCLQEELVEREAPALGIAVRVIRPAALVDWREPVLPGLMGRRLFGRWHLGLGRPGLPIAVCGVERCAELIAWCATHFDEAPLVVNLLDDAIATRGDLVARLRAAGWTGRVLWMPISLVALATTAARTAGAGRRRGGPGRLAAWSILRPRRYDARIAAAMLRAASRDTLPPGVAAVALPA